MLSCCLFDLLVDMLRFVRQVVCTVYLRELQEQRGLTDDALQHIARVAGPRHATLLVARQGPDPRLVYI